jgi:transcriptional regulator with XRE-family HTH domain
MIENKMNFQKSLYEIYLKLKERNSSFSLRAFAKKIDVSSGELSEIFSGKRNVSLNKAKKIASKLILSPDEKMKLFSTFLEDEDELFSGPNRELVDQYELNSDPLHFAILSLFELDNFKSDESWIAEQLGLSLKESNLKLERLKRLNVIITDTNGQILPTGKSFTTTDNIKNMSVRKAHFENLKLAEHALETRDLEERDFTAITMPIDPAKMNEAKIMIRKFRDELSLFLESGKKTEVYKMNIQFFPLTRNISGAACEKL